MWFFVQFSFNLNCWCGTENFSDEPKQKNRLTEADRQNASEQETKREKDVGKGRAQKKKRIFIATKYFINFNNTLKSSPSQKLKMPQCQQLSRAQIMQIIGRIDTFQMWAPVKTDSLCIYVRVHVYFASLSWPKSLLMLFLSLAFSLLYTYIFIHYTCQMNGHDIFPFLPSGRYFFFVLFSCHGLNSFSIRAIVHEFGVSKK